MNNFVLKEYAHLASNYDARWSFYINATIHETMKRIDLKPTDRLLDVGCGTGALLQAVCTAFPSVEATGIDPSSEMLNVARRKLADRVVLREGWAEALPFPDCYFDIVASCNSFHFWRKPEIALYEIMRVLKPTGSLIITDWCDDYLTCRVCDLILRLINRAHFRTYGTSECECLLGATGFRRVSIERYKINWLWGMMTAVAKR